MTKGIDYFVEKKEEIRKLSPTHEVMTYYRIWATSKGGTYFHVEIPEGQLANADELLTKKAKALDSI